MIRPLDSLEQTSDVVEVDLLPQAEIARNDLKGGASALARPIEASAQRLVRHSLERLAGATTFGTQASCDVVFERQGGSYCHIMNRNSVTS